MVTLAEEPEAQPSTEERLARSIIAGHPQGAVRRILLYLALGVAVFVGVVSDGPVGIFAGGSAILTLLLLAMTDQLA